MGFLGFGKKKRVRDPVCQMEIPPASAVGSESHDGQTFYFCSAHCMSEFRQDPHKYAHAK